jgi:hypothetical protein
MPAIVDPRPESDRTEGEAVPDPGTRIALIASMAVSLVFWFLAEGLGGLFTGQATDVGAGPLMILIAALLLPLAERRAPSPSPARVQASPAQQM